VVNNCVSDFVCCGTRVNQGSEPCLGSGDIGGVETKVQQVTVAVAGIEDGELRRWLLSYQCSVSKGEEEPHHLARLKLEVRHIRRGR